MCKFFRILTSALFAVTAFSVCAAPSAPPDAGNTDKNANAGASRASGYPFSDKKLEQLEKECDAGEATSCEEAGVRYAQARGVTRDASMAQKFHEKACDGGVPASCTYLGFLRFYGKGGMKQDIREAERLYRKACDGGEFHACSNLGKMYGRAEGVERDFSKAREFLEKSCNGGVSVGCAGLGDLYFRGLGVEQDQSKAAALLEKACDPESRAMDIQNACTSIGMLYMQGIGVEKNDAKAVGILEKSCDRSNLKACTVLGAHLATVNEPAKGIGLMKKACDGSLAEACSVLGAFYVDGPGVERNTDKAVEYLTKACALKHSPSCEAAAYLKENPGK
ncbi:MAG: sel1 repeat family protein [Candidatus Accumulibacter sp.]|jgi:TPR repeat protein|nr:sel1 repeat family protein [Accumulibacter sp.]